MNDEELLAKEKNSRTFISHKMLLSVPESPKIVMDELSTYNYNLADYIDAER